MFKDPRNPTTEELEAYNNKLKSRITSITTLYVDGVPINKDENYDTWYKKYQQLIEFERSNRL